MQTEYTPKGTYEHINGYKTYVSGPEDSDRAIVMIYDIFGFSPQILQGESASHEGQRPEGNRLPSLSRNVLVC